MSEQVPELVRGMRPLLNAFELLDINYFIGGSVASSAHGLPRSTLDVDLVAEITLRQAAELVTALETEYYVELSAVEDAVRKRSSFNAIHLETMLKVDVFILRREAYDLSAFQRAKHARLALDQGVFDVRLSTAEDVILRKLHWYRLGGEVSERQWSDVAGVFAVQGKALDYDYLRQWASSLGISDLLDRAIAEFQG